MDTRKEERDIKVIILAGFITFCLVGIFVVLKYAELLDRLK